MRWVAFKSLACVAVVCLVLFLGQVWREAVCPPMQTDVAVEQLLDSDEAHAKLRTFEAKRNVANVGIAGAVLLAMLGFWSKEIVAAVRSLAKGGDDVG